MQKILRCALLAVSATTLSAAEQGRSLFMPILSYYTGPYSVNGTPFANGFLDYMMYVNQTGGIGGAAIETGACETGYNTKRGVKCYDRLKAMNPLAINMLSTGIAYALAPQAEKDHIPLSSIGYGVPGAMLGNHFAYTFPVYADYYSGTEAKVQYIAEKVGGYDKLKGLKIAYVVHKSIYGTATKQLIERLAQKYGFKVDYVLVPHPGVDQKEAWQTIESLKPDYIFFRGWGIMNKSMLEYAKKHGYPLDKIVGVWWSANTVDVEAMGMDAKGYTGLSMLPSLSDDVAILQAIREKVYDLGMGKGESFEKNIRSTLYREGVLQAALTVEAARTAQRHTGKVFLTPEEMAKYGYEKLDITEERIQELGLAGLMVPVQLNCNRHGDDTTVSIIQWDGSKWNSVAAYNNKHKALVDEIRNETALKSKQSLKISNVRACN